MMDRRTEIIEAAKSRVYPRFTEDYLKTMKEPDVVNIALTTAYAEGAKWADEHPSDETILKIIDMQLDLAGKLLVSDEEPFTTYQDEVDKLDTASERNELFDKYMVKLIKERWNDYKH